MRYLVVAAIVLSPVSAVGEDLDAPDPSTVTSKKIYHYENRYFSLALGGGALVDYNRFWQDEDSESQLDLRADSAIRDLRLLVYGRLYWDWLSYTAGYAYVGSADEWRWRQSGIKIQIDALNGFLFLGRTKEGFSTNKFNTGYYGWFNERPAVNDAFIPILADGARWTGTAWCNRIVYNIGGFADVVSDVESFNKNDWQFAGRVVWLPLGGDPETQLLHVALEGRYAGANDGMLQYKSKPEAFIAPDAVDTGLFPARRSTTGGVETYYVRGPLSMGLELFGNWVSSKSADDPFFHGGELFAAYMFTGETHPYKATTATFQDVKPKKTFFEGGWGAWELAMRLSYVDLDSGTITGGRLVRYNALVNWYLTESLRLEAAYGYGALDRFDLMGNTHFLMTRFQFQVK
jgi:phosphate-selective porin OprO/OprP